MLHRRMILTIAAGLVALSMSPCALAENLYVSDTYGKVYVLRLTDSLQWEYLSAMPRSGPQHVSFACEPTRDRLYAFSSHDNRVSMLDPSTGDADVRACDGVRYYASGARFSADGSTLYVVAALDGVRGWAGVLADAVTFEVIRVLELGLPGIHPRGGTGFSVEKAVFADTGADLLIWSYAENALLAYAAPFRDAKILYRNEGAKLPFTGTSVRRDEIIFTLSQALDSRQKLTVVKLGQDAVTTDSVEVDHVPLMAEAAVCCPLWGFYDGGANSMRLFGRNGHSAESFGVPLALLENEQISIRPYRLVDVSDLKGPLSVVEVWLSNSGAYTILGLDGGGGVRTMGHILVRDNVKKLWSDPIPVGPGPPMIAADWR